MAMMSQLKNRFERPIKLANALVSLVTEKLRWQILLRRKTCTRKILPFKHYETMMDNSMMKLRDKLPTLTGVGNEYILGSGRNARKLLKKKITPFPKGTELDWFWVSSFKSVLFKPFWDMGKEGRRARPRQS